MEPFLLAGVTGALASWLVPKSVRSFKDMLKQSRHKGVKEASIVHLLHAMESRLSTVEKNQSLMVSRFDGFSQRLVEKEDTGAKALAHSQELAKTLEGHVEQCKEAYRTMGDIGARAERTAIQAKERVESAGKSWQALDERIKQQEADLAATTETCADHAEEVKGSLEALQEKQAAQGLAISRLENGVSSLADEVAARLDNLGRRIESLPAETENVSGMAEALREMGDWRAQDAGPKLAALGEALMLLPAIQEQTAILSESNSQMRSVLVDVADKVEVIESIVGRLPGPEPRTPMGPPPAGRSTDELAELMQQRSALQQTFLQRAAARGGLPIQPPSRP